MLDEKEVAERIACLIGEREEFIDGYLADDIIQIVPDESLSERDDRIAGLCDIAAEQWYHDPNGARDAAELDHLKDVYYDITGRQFPDF